LALPTSPTLSGLMRSVCGKKQPHPSRRELSDDYGALEVGGRPLAPGTGTMMALARRWRSAAAAAAVSVGVTLDAARALGSDAPGPAAARGVQDVRPPGPTYVLYAADGSPARASDVARHALRAADVLLVGEAHGDPGAHRFEADVFAELRSRAPRADPARPLVLSLEMFEREVQPVVDEYLSGLTREVDLVRDGRAWPNYARDYRALVEGAREGGVPVLAANAPRRLVGLVSREGPGALARLPRASRGHLAPLPAPAPSAALAAKVQAELAGAAAQIAAARGGAAGQPGCPAGFTASADFLAAQGLWDATMAHSIAGALGRGPGGALVVHLCGRFHCEEGLGIPEHLARYAPRARVLTAVVRPAPGGRLALTQDEFRELRLGRFGDFVCLTEGHVVPPPPPPPAGGARPAAAGGAAGEARA